MIERLQEMPEGTIGFRVSGEVTRADYTDVLIPELRRLLDAGEKVRQLYLIDGMKEIDPGALWADAKVGFDFQTHHRHALEKAAIVTDQEWLAKAIRLFGFMAPGELRLFGSTELDEAKDWVAG